MPSLNGNRRLLPQVREHETHLELVWQVEIPARDRVSLSLDGRLLTISVIHRRADGPNVGFHPDGTAV